MLQFQILAKVSDFSFLFYFLLILFSETVSSFRLIRYKTEDVYGDENSNHVTSLKILQTVANAVSHQYFGSFNIFSIPQSF